jgi:hypothetical protein
MALEAVFALTGSGTLTSPKDLSTPTDAVAIGSGNFDEVAIEFADGNGSEEAEAWWHDERTVAATTADNIDLAGSLTGPFGVTVTALKIKWIILAIDTPDGIKTIRVGPRGVSNAFQGPWGGTGATVYQDVTHHLPLFEPFTGWTVTAGTGDILGIYNPSAVSVTYRIWIGFTIT